MNKPLQQQLHEDTAALAMKSGRRVGQPGHAIAMDYIRSRMDEIGLTPYIGDSFMLPYSGYRPNEMNTWADPGDCSAEDDEDEFLRQELAMELSGAAGVIIRPTSSNTEEHDFCNLVGVIPGRDRSLPPLLVGAHYDSVIDAPCADDNATSVALNLAIAEAFVGSPLERDLIIAFFDAEEPPYFHSVYMGSTRFFEDHCANIQFAGVIVTDLIGHDLDVSNSLKQIGGKVPGIGLVTGHFRDIVFLLGAESDGVLPEVVEKVAAGRKGLRVFPTLNRYIGNMSDHHAFEQAGQPFLFLSCGQGKYYHHPKDTLDWINFGKLARITEFVRDLLAQLDLTPAGKAPYASDPFAFESRMIRKVVGKPVELIAKGFGFEIPKTRAGIDRFVGKVTASI
jgi:hypothetical protein